MRLEEDVGAVLVDDLVVLGRAVNDRELQGIERVDVDVLSGGDTDAGLLGLLLRRGRLLIAVAAVSVIASKALASFPNLGLRPGRTPQPTLVWVFASSGERNVAAP